MREATIRRKAAEIMKPTDTVLDIGCGQGSLIKFLSDRVYTVIGIDYPSNRFPNVLTKTSHVNTYYIYGNAEFIPTTERFDVAVCSHVCHELSRPQIVLHETYRVLKKDGIILIADFARGHRGEKLWKERFYTSQEIETMIVNSGFRDINVEQASYEHFIFATAKKPKSIR